MAEHDWPNTCGQPSVRPHSVHYSRGGWISLSHVVSCIKLVRVLDSLEARWVLVGYTLVTRWSSVGYTLDTGWFPLGVTRWLLVGSGVLLVGSWSKLCIYFIYPC